MMNDDIFCAFSGLAPKEDEYIEGSDELGELPVNWTKITIQTRRENPDWLILQNVKQAMVQQLATQIDEGIEQEAKEIATLSIQLQVEAQFAALEDRYSRFVIEEVSTFVSDVTQNQEIKEMYDKLIQDLDLQEQEADDAAV